jgi:hypothetical protein
MLARSSIGLSDRFEFLLASWFRSVAGFLSQSAGFLNLSVDVIVMFGSDRHHFPSVSAAKGAAIIKTFIGGRF